MNTAPRMIVALSAAAVLAAVVPTVNAAPQTVAPEPAVSCQNDFEAYTEAWAEIHTAEQHATTTERRTLHLELVQLLRYLGLESC